ncbi:hypothetical protein B0T26DRAFT_725418 [Lasiosphaeria miniovina]|uniref:NACHT domain-containing protein n=1 Tax=Lasiosphaeria miniovina TaxID=1954250 RepID=A0AA39ZYU5_9PEZI|nr:uncharacterized protein B0T26DRAFT_725418 [Lasiosphaeria miniovina]KAK0706095.1 hypothetical protein B0T26DRAFT_725418 [Lasiosphaeria miniovina]
MIFPSSLPPPISAFVLSRFPAGKAHRHKMDPLSIAASIFAVIQIADRVISLCKFYLELASDAPSDLRVILIEASALKAILDNIQFLASNGHGPVSLNTLIGKEGPVEGCRKALHHMSALFPAESAQGTLGIKSKRQKVAEMLHTLGWSFKETKARRLLAEVVQHKTTLNLALTVDISHDIKKIKGKAGEIQTALSGIERRDVYKWLEGIDPSSLHHRACSQYEPGTGGWVLRSDDWKAWISGPNRALWIHGIPGAGKTVLASHLIENVKTRCNAGDAAKSRNAYVYYYCYFGHNTDEALHFLRWIIRQLGRAADTMPANLYKLYRRGEGPSLSDLFYVLEEMMEAFDCVYVILDAIDESMPRTNLLKVLRDLITDPRFSKTRVLATSREYLDIEESMKGISTSISMRNPLLDEDIRLFVQAQLKTHPKLRLWPASVQDEALEALSAKAKGMFRWVVCQIDILQRLKGDKATILKALVCLPRTLDETYERIFLQIPHESRLVVHHALKWIYAHDDLRVDNIPASNLIQAIQRSTALLGSSGYDYDYNVDLLRDLCGCLISLSPQERDNDDVKFQPTTAVAFAHYTVLEFLDSTRIRNGPASFFAIDEELVKLEFAKMVMLEALDTEPNDIWDTEDIYLGNEKIADAIEESFNLYSIVSSILAVKCWGQTLASDTTLCELAFAMLNATSQHFEHLAHTAACIENATHVFSSDLLYEDEQFWNLSWRQLPTNDAVRTLINLLFTDESSELGRKFVQSIRAGSWLQSSVDLSLPIWHPISEEAIELCQFEGTLVELFALFSNGRSDALKLFLELVIGYFDPSKILLHLVGWHTHDGNDGSCNGSCILARQLQLGADPDGPGYRICPLQIAARMRDLKGVRLLLEAGANPNHTGDQKGEVWKEGTVLARFNNILDCSPLNIVQTMGCYFVGDQLDKRKEDVPKIVALMREYGARSFTRTEAES